MHYLMLMIHLDMVIISRVVNTIGDIFSKSALDTFGKIYINNKRRHNNDKPW
jgi:fructose-1,6-bisphosphatase